MGIYRFGEKLALLQYYRHKYPLWRRAALVLINEKILINYKIRNTRFQDESS